MGLKPGAKAGFWAYWLLMGVAESLRPWSDCEGEGWGAYCWPAGENGCGEAVETRCGTPPGRSWFVMMGDGLALAEPFCRCE